MTDDYFALKLDQQICFPLYSVSRLVTKKYKPLLQKLGVTYPQYLVLLVLWEEGEIPVKRISERLFLDTNTLTPLLKRMENSGLIERNRSKLDERSVLISLTTNGENLREQARNIPSQLVGEFDCFLLEKQEIEDLKRILDKILNEV